MAVKLIKRTVAAVFLALVVWAFFGGHRLANLAVSLQAVPAMLRNPWVFVPAFLVGTALIGRFFCEMMCPLGILQSLVNWLFHPKSSVRRVCTRLPETKAQIAVRWTIVAVVAALVAAGYGALAWSLEPYSILGRSLTLVGVFPVAMLFILLAAAVGRGRVWCNWVCPVGTVFNLIGRIAPWGNKVEGRCKNCRKCFPKAKPAAPQAGSASDAAEQPTDGMTRREAVKGVVLLAAAEKLTDGGYADVSYASRATRARSVLPPGAVARGMFTRKCLACGLCIKACPVKVLKPSLKALTFGQPELDFNAGACRTGCDRQCAKACPAGAIQLLDGVPRKDVHVGVAKWDLHKCLRNTDGVECTLCARKCPVKAIHWVDGADGGKILCVDEVACMGCGECEHSCAARPEPAIVVEGLDIQRIFRPMRGDGIRTSARTCR